MTLSVDIGAAFTAQGATFDLDVAFTAGEAQTLVLLGPSGSGKTLILETIAGFHPHRGQITLDGQSLAGHPPEHRGFGFVFQDYALFPHLSVRDNVTFGARYRDAGSDPQALMQRLEIAHLAARYPATLSGGEQQRVALARALMVRPKVLLLDEPLSSLDRPARDTLRTRLTEILADVTAIYVTHDRDEARILGDRVAVVRNGQISQIGTPETIFAAPNDPFVARFTGSNCIALKDLPANGAQANRASNSQFLVIRPEDVQLHQPAGHSMDGAVVRVVPEGAHYRVTVSIGATELDSLTTTPPATATVGVAWEGHKARML